MSRSHFFFFNDTATTEIYTLSLHDALPISSAVSGLSGSNGVSSGAHTAESTISPTSSRPISNDRWRDRKSTRLNSSHPSISYAVFCLKKKKKKNQKNHK